MEERAYVGMYTYNFEANQITQWWCASPKFLGFMWVWTFHFENLGFWAGSGSAKFALDGYSGKYLRIHRNLNFQGFLLVKCEPQVWVVQFASDRRADPGGSGLTHHYYTVVSVSKIILHIWKRMLHDLLISRVCEIW